MSQNNQIQFKEKILGQYAKTDANKRSNCIQNINKPSYKTKVNVLGLHDLYTSHN